MSEKDKIELIDELLEDEFVDEVTAKLNELRVTYAVRAIGEPLWNVVNSMAEIVSAFWNVAKDILYEAEEHEETKICITKSYAEYCTEEPTDVRVYEGDGDDEKLIYAGFFVTKASTDVNGDMLNINTHVEFCGYINDENSSFVMHPEKDYYIEIGADRYIIKGGQDE